MRAGWLLISSGIAALAVSSPAIAQDSSSHESTARSRDNAGFEEIIVTARRREESLQDVPVAITAFSGSDIENKTLRQMDDLRNFVPGLNVQGLKRDDSTLYIRGQGPGSQVTGQRNFSSIATYFAEVPTEISGPGVFYDLTNIQVLKGPQGTLFGRNTTGGAVLFEPAAPIWENEGSVQVQVGNYDMKQFNGVVNVSPVPDRVAIRLAAEIARRDGFTQSIYTGQKYDDRRYEGFRASLRLAPTDAIENTTIFSYRNRNQVGSSFVTGRVEPTVPFGAIPVSAGVKGGLAAAGITTTVDSLPLLLGGSEVDYRCLSAALAGCPAPVLGSGALGAYAAALEQGSFYYLAPRSVFDSVNAIQAEIGPRKVQTTSLGREEKRDWSVINRTTVQIADNLLIKNIISFQKSRSLQLFDYDGAGALDTLEQTSTPNRWQLGSEQFTEEVQVQGSVPSANLDYLVGFYYEKEKPGFLMETRGRTLGNLAIRQFDHNDDSKAVFGHVEWNPLSFLGVSGGIRQTWDGRYSEVSLLAADGTCNQTAPGTTDIQCPVALSSDFKATTYDATVSLKPTEGVLGYVSYRKGYKSGGLNFPAPPVPEFQSFDPEYVKEWEVGLKADLSLGNVPVRLDAAYFHDDYANLQVSQSTNITLPDGSTSSVLIILNNANAKNQGVELSGTVSPIQGLSLSGFFSWIDAHFTNTIVGAIEAGRQVRATPKYKFGFSVAYTLPLDESLGKITLFADYAHQSSSFADNRVDAGAAYFPVIPGYGLLNARVAWDRVLDSSFDLAVFMTNVTDKTYIQGGYPVTALGFQSFVYGEPRMYGLSAKYHF